MGDSSHYEEIALIGNGIYIENVIHFRLYLLSLSHALNEGPLFSFVEDNGGGPGGDWGRDGMHQIPFQQVVGSKIASIGIRRKVGRRH